MKQKSIGGFTFIELLVVVTLSAVVMTTGFLYLGGYRTEQNLKLTASEMFPNLKNTQRLSMSQQDGKKWGMHFSNTTSSQSYSVFSGASYATSGVSQIYFMRRNVSFSNPWTSSTIDVIFNAVTGYPSQGQVISLVTGRNDGFVNDITMNTLGMITSKFDTGLVGYWHLDENTSSTAYDASGRGNSGILTNSPTWQTGANCKTGSCLNFNGTNNYIAISDATALRPAALTITAWVKTSATTQTGCIVAKQLSTGTNNSYALYADAGKMTICVGPSGGSCAGSVDPNDLPSNTWTHFAGVFNESTTTLYRNAVQIDTDAQAITVGYDANPIHIGADSDDAVSTPETCWFNGNIDETRVYNRALSATEIADQYNALR